MIFINPGMKISIKIVVTRRKRSNKLKTVLANSLAFIFPLANSIEYDGTNAALKVPSENNLLNVFGTLNATKKASANGPDPRYIAIKKSLTYPSILLIRIKILNVPVDLIMFINHISLNLDLIVYFIIQK